MKTVDRGAAFLDEKLPGWEDQIDLEQLDLSSRCNCVLGQLYKRPRERNTWHRYDRGLNALGIETPSKYGFTIWGSGTFEGLDRAWRRLIELRRKAADGSDS